MLTLNTGNFGTVSRVPTGKSVLTCNGEKTPIVSDTKDESDCNTVCPRASRSVSSTKSQRTKSGRWSGGALSMPIVKVKENDAFYHRLKKNTTVAEFNNIRNQMSARRPYATIYNHPGAQGDPRCSSEDLTELMQSAITPLLIGGGSHVGKLSERFDSPRSSKNEQTPKTPTRVYHQYLSTPQTSPLIGHSSDKDLRLMVTPAFSIAHTKREATGPCDVNANTPDTEQAHHPIVKQYINGYAPHSGFHSNPATPEDVVLKKKNGWVNGVSAPRVQDKTVPHTVNLRFITANGEQRLNSNGRPLSHSVNINSPAKGHTLLRGSTTSRNRISAPLTNQPFEVLPVPRLAIPPNVPAHFQRRFSPTAGNTDFSQLSVRNLSIFDQIHQTSSTRILDTEAVVDTRVADWVGQQDEGAQKQKAPQMV